MRRTRTRLAAIAMTAGLALAGCGGDDSTDEAAGDAAVFTDGTATFVGTDAIAWEADTIQATATDGTLEVTLDCPGTVPHNLVIEGVAGGEELLECEGGDQPSTTIDIEPGTYRFICTVPGHEAAGMVGELTVS